MKVGAHAGGRSFDRAQLADLRRAAGRAQIVRHEAVRQLREQHREPERDEREVEALHSQRREADQHADRERERGRRPAASATNGQPCDCIRIAVVYMPNPKNAPCPIDTWPLYPVSRLRPIAATPM